MNLIRVVLASVVILLLSACGNVEKVEHIEDFIAETMKQNEKVLLKIQAIRR